MAPPPMRTWLPWSELVKGPRVTVEGFRDILRKYPRSSILRACARLSVLFNYGPDAGTVRLIPAQFVRPFVKSNKNDYRDAEAIAEAVERENMRFVPIKTEDQLDLQALHRARERLVSRRTSVINQLRAFLLERGISFAKGPASLRRQMPEILENADERLIARMRCLLDFLWQEWKHLQLQIETWRRQRTRYPPKPLDDLVSA